MIFNRNNQAKMYLKYTIAIIIIIFTVLFVRIESTSVVIIGAGAAGIAAATRLLENNVTDLIVLEAEDRIGGRVFSKPFGDAIVELGANACYGTVGNVIYDMVHQYDLLQPIPDKMLIVVSDGTNFGRNLSDELAQIVSDIYALETTSDDGTMGNFVQKTYNKTIQARFANTPQLKLAEMTFDMVERHVELIEGTFSWHDTDSSSHYQSINDDAMTDWKGKGFNQLFDIMMKKPPVKSSTPLPLDDKILLKKEVTHISWAGEKSEVKCKDGTSYTADHVIFTPSLGVLKADHATLFEPDLPEEKVQTIKDLGIGGVMKVVLHFPERWWPPGDRGVVFVWTKEDEQKAMEEFPHGPNKNGVSWLSSIASASSAENNDKAMYLWISGDLVPQIEDEEITSDKVIMDGIDYLFKKFFGEKYQMAADKMLRSNWYSNPHFRGSYSFETFASRAHKECSHNVLAKPLTDNKVLFAGEATHKTRYGSVDGAVLTGYREADRILSSINTV